MTLLQVMGKHHTMVCIFMCNTFIIPPYLWAAARQWRAYKATDRHQHVSTRVSAQVYIALRKYYQEDKNFDFFALDKEEFLAQFRSDGLNGSMMEELAVRVFEDWKEKMLESMLHQDPGF